MADEFYDLCRFLWRDEWGVPPKEIATVDDLPKLISGTVRAIHRRRGSHEFKVSRFGEVPNQFGWFEVETVSTSRAVA